MPGLHSWADEEDPKEEARLVWKSKDLICSLSARGYMPGPGAVPTRKQQRGDKTPRRMDSLTSPLN